MITHPDKVLFPDAGITKGELAAYYEAIASVMVPHIRRRPVTMERFPNGLGRKGFIQKDVSKGFPEWLERVTVPKKGGVVHYPLVTDTRSLLWMVNQNCITPHVWISREPALMKPDLCVFDLDPSSDDPGVLRSVVLALRDVLAELKLASWVKTSGSKGFHVVVPVGDGSGYDDVARLAQGVASVMIARDPTHLTQEFSKADRDGRIYMDVGRNHPGATFAAVYAVRARPGAPVSAPCTWEEIERGKVGPQTFTLRTMARRMKEVGDLWADLNKRKRSITSAVDRLRSLVDRPGPSADRSETRGTTARSKRTPR
ncbi:MAG TPA: non-homologous end-joining DNA ligase [Vicinamibacterales bacterium]|nr:non-homologous end-joining DNA ligase [Vicinamibacterales bacterium]